VIDIEQQAAAEAERFRDDNGLGVAPIADIVALIEQTQGVDVAVLDVDDGDEHGLTMTDPERAVTIVAVASSEHPMRWRSTLGHELGHLTFGDHRRGEPASLTYDVAVERRAQVFARHLLLPADAVHRFMAGRDPSDVATSSDLVQRFQVSPKIAAIQLRDTGYLDPSGFDQLTGMVTPTLAARFGWMDQYRALQAESRQRRSPQRLLARAISGYIAGVVTVETLASIRGIPVDDLAAELADARITPPEPHGVVTPTVADVDEAGDFIDLSWLDNR
jgi:Zn-dependent peptidase ImmA (M78 family)